MEKRKKVTFKKPASQRPEIIKSTESMEDYKKTTEEVREKINQLGDKTTDPKKKEAAKVFKEHLHGILNSVEKEMDEFMDNSK